MMTDEAEQIDVIPNEPITNDDLEQLNELDAILAEATEVDGGVVDETGNVVEHVETMEIETSELLFPIVSSMFDIFSPKWKVKKAEKEALSQAYGALLDKYFPDASNMFGVELTALTVTAMVVAPRMMQPEQPEEKPTKTIESKDEKTNYDFSHKPLIQEIEGFKFD